MRFALVLAFLAGPALVSATLEPALANIRGKCPSSFQCKPTTISTGIQAAECAYNTRTHEKQTFAVFVTDHQDDGVSGHPYGSCSAYTCNVPTSAQMADRPDCWTFFWAGNNKNNSVGTDCIKDSTTGECGCENSIDGKFIAGKTDCK